VTIRPIEPSDAATWERLRRELWPEDPESHAVEVASFFAGTLPEPQAVLVAQEGPNLIAFAELSIREDIRGLAGTRVGYVEGLYVTPAFRSRGIARTLLLASKSWARENHCEAFASDRAERLIVDPKFCLGRTIPPRRVRLHS
jgi:aminoglycoside 6'-N-acetyltransferase I